MATRINHKSDFTSYEQFTRYDKPVAVPERVRITYFTETGFPRCFVAERNGDILKNCSLSDDGMSLRVYVALSRQYIGTGPLKKIITETVEDANFPNGEKRLDSVAESNVVLWSGNSDNGLDTEDESELLPFRYGYSAYELAKIHGYEGTEEEYALAPLLAINELENYAKKDLSNVDEAEFAYKNVLPTSVWECRLDDDPETATPGIRDFWKMNMIELWEAANKQRRLLVKSTGIGTLVSPVSCSYVESPSGDRFVSAQIIFLGADDYVVKPFSLIELTARIKANIRRARTYQALPNNSIIKIKDIEIDPHSHMVQRKGVTIDLTPIEFQILYILASHPGQAYSKERLYELIWKEPYFGNENVLNTHINRLRLKLKSNAEDSTAYVKTLWGIGYKMEEK